MSVTAAIRKMLAQGFTIDQALDAAETFEVEMTPQRTARQDRNARYYARKASEKRLKTSETSKSDASVLNQTPSRADDAPDLENKQTNKQGSKKENKTPREELALVLDAEHADAVLDHRQRLRKPLSQRAAHLLAASLASCPDANAAADQMIESGWLKIKPGWLETRSRQNGHAPPSHAEQVNAVLDEIINGKSHDDEHPGPTIDTSFDRTDRGSSANLVQFDAFAARR